MDNLSDSPSLPVTELSDRAHQAAEYGDTDGPLIHGGRAEIGESNHPRKFSQYAAPVRSPYDTGGACAAARPTRGPTTQSLIQFADQTSGYVAQQPLRSIGMAAVAGFLFAVFLNGLRRPR